MRSPGLRFGRIVLVLSVGVCEDERTTIGVGISEAARCGIGGNGTGYRASGSRGGQ